MSADLTGSGSTTRTAARVVVIDDVDRTLLFRGGDPGRPEEGTWWFTPGGGVEDGEGLAEAARRELREETGFTVTDVGEPVRVRRVRFQFEGAWYDQVEHFFVVRVGAAGEVSDAEWTEIERRVVVEHRWWTLDELRSTGDTVYPEELVDLLAAALAGA